MRLITFFISNSKANKILIAMERQDDGYHERADRQIQNVAIELGLGGFVEKLRDQLMLVGNHQRRQRLARL